MLAPVRQQWWRGVSMHAALACKWSEPNNKRLKIGAAVHRNYLQLSTHNRPRVMLNPALLVCRHRRRQTRSQARSGRSRCCTSL